MTVVTWVASDTASWIFFGIGMLSAALAIVVAPFVQPRRPGRITWFFADWLAWIPTVVGPLLLLGGAVLAGTGTGRLSWLSILSGAVCLAAIAFRSLLLVALHDRDWIAHETDRLRTSSSSSMIASSTADAVYQKLTEQDPYRGRTAPFTSRSASMIADAVYRKLTEQNPYRLGWSAPFTSMIADAVYQKFTMQGERLSQTVDSFEDFATSMVRRGVWAPVSIYTAADDGTRLKDAVATVLREFELAIAVEEPPAQGSWRQRFWARSRELAGSEPVRKRLEKLERAVELQILGKAQAEIDKVKAESVAALCGLLKEQDNAVVRLGSIILIKAEGDLVVGTIGEMEAAALEKNSELLGDPVAALKFLRSCKRAQESIGSDPPDRDTPGD